MRRRALAATFISLCACAPPLAELATYPDAPLALRDDSDRVQATDAMLAMPAGPVRDAARAAITDAIALRLDDALSEAQPIAAAQLALELAGLWQDDPQTVGAGLAAHAALLHRMRDVFAKSGALEPAAATLAMLAEAEPAQAAHWRGELDELLAFAAGGTPSDDNDDGDDGADTRPVALLASVAGVLPLPWLVDRELAALEAQPVVDARRITGALARAGRIAEIARRVVARDPKLAALAAHASAPGATADDYSELAIELLTSAHDLVADPAAALAVCQRGLAHFPHDARLLATAADAGAGEGRLAQPIASYRAALAAGGDDAITILRFGRLASEAIGRLAYSGRPGAAWRQWQALRGEAKRERRGSPQAWDQVLAHAETSLGRGLLNQGRLGEAQRALVGSLETAPSIDAYEALTLLYYKTGRLGAATQAASAGLATLGDSTADQYRRARLERIAGDIMREAGRTHDAAELYLDAVRGWTSLGDDRGLPRSLAAERLLELSRGMWYLGSSDKAVDLALAAADVAPDSGTTTADTVAFLLEVDRPADARDAVHRGLGAPELGELDKVYVSLWVLADAHRRGEAPDRQAAAYLASRHGDLWYERLAEAASGHLAWQALEAAATTAPEKAALAFYGASLGLDPGARDPASAKKLYERALDAHLVMDAEYDLARKYLATP